MLIGITLAEYSLFGGRFNLVMDTISVLPTSRIVGINGPRVVITAKPWETSTVKMSKHFVFPLVNSRFRVVVPYTNVTVTSTSVSVNVGGSVYTGKEDQHPLIGLSKWALKQLHIKHFKLGTETTVFLIIVRSHT